MRKTPWQQIRCMFGISLLLVWPTWAAGQENGFARWEKSIAAFEAADAKQMPAPGGIVFVGSSSIRLWDTEKWFPEQDIINRGFGGSQIADSAHFADRIILKYRPRVVVLYAGDNDISAKKTPARVAADFHRFTDAIHNALPETKIVFIAIKPSLRRWEIYETMAQANRLIQQQCQDDKRLQYLDIAGPMLGDDGKPRGELFAKDGLHLSEEGYRLWTSLLKPHLK